MENITENSQEQLTVNREHHTDSPTLDPTSVVIEQDHASLPYPSDASVPLPPPPPPHAIASEVEHLYPKAKRARQQRPRNYIDAATAIPIHIHVPETPKSEEPTPPPQQNGPIVRRRNVFHRRLPDDQQKKKVGQPENVVVKALRGVMPVTAILDLTVAAEIATLLVLGIFAPGVANYLENVWMVIFRLFPTAAVMMTGLISAALITARLSSLEADTADIATIKDETAKKERRAFLESQIKVCREQRWQAIALVIFYVVLVSIPEVAQFDTTKGFGRIFQLILNVGEMIVPVMNMRTFSIVESSMLKNDPVSSAIYEASAAAMALLGGIAHRATGGSLNKSDLRILRMGRLGKIDKMLEKREPRKSAILNEMRYVSLRQAVTHVPDNMPLTDEMKKIYAKALGIARRYRDTGDEATQLHFAYRNGNRLYVTEIMAGRINDELPRVQTRKGRSDAGVKKTTGQGEAVAVLTEVPSSTTQVP
jgi:hypothetical protein